MVTRRTFVVSLIVAFLAGGLAGVATGAFGGYRSGMALVLSACQKTPVFKSSAAPILPGAAFFRDLFSGTTEFAVL